VTDKSLEEEIEAALALLGETPSMALDEKPADPKTVTPPPQQAQVLQEPMAEQPEEPTPTAASLVPASPTEAAILAPEELPQPFAAPLSPTLAALDESRRPKVEVVCATCPNSMWFSTPKEVACYCRVMFLQTWTTKAPGQIVACDGTAIGRE